MHFGFGVQNAGVVSLLSNLDLTHNHLSIFCIILQTKQG